VAVVAVVDVIHADQEQLAVLVAQAAEQMVLLQLLHLQQRPQILAVVAVVVHLMVDS
jgi:hypothetical protein